GPAAYAARCARVVCAGARWAGRGVMVYTAVIIEGGLFPADLLDRLAEGSAPGQRPEDFGLPASARLSDEIQGAFSDARAFWDAFQRRLARPHESTFTLTRQAWVEPLLERLGWTLHPVRSRRAGDAVLQRPYN